MLSKRCVQNYGVQMFWWVCFAEGVVSDQLRISPCIEWDNFAIKTPALFGKRLLLKAQRYSRFDTIFCFRTESPYIMLQDKMKKSSSGIRQFWQCTWTQSHITQTMSEGLIENTSPFVVSPWLEFQGRNRWCWASYGLSGRPRFKAVPHHSVTSHRSKRLHSILNQISFPSDYAQMPYNMQSWLSILIPASNIPSAK